MTTQNQVSIPLEQGRVFRLIANYKYKDRMSFQSLWSRAGSFDAVKRTYCYVLHGFNPFGAGQGLSTNIMELL